MMWNFKADIDLDEYKGYGDYHNLWQIVGFIYPLIGLLCFFIPICIVTEPEEKLKLADGGRKEIDLDTEEDDYHKNKEKAYLTGLKAQREAEEKSKNVGHCDNATEAQKAEEECVKKEEATKNPDAPPVEEGQS